MNETNYIPSDKLTLRAIPRSKANWSELSRFALTFDPTIVDIRGYGTKAGDLSNATKDSSINQLRAHLYVEQRRWNHYCREPDMQTLMKLRQILDWIREKIVESKQDV
jgi:hypothetical protein